MNTAGGQEIFFFVPWLAVFGFVLDFWGIVQKTQGPTGMKMQMRVYLT